MKTVEVSAKSKEMAIKEGLTQLGATIDMVNIEVISEGGLFSKCKLKMTLIEEDLFDSVVPSKSAPVQPVKPAPAPTAKEEKEKRLPPAEKEEKPIPAQKAAPIAAQPQPNERERKRPPKSDGFTYPVTVKFVEELMARFGTGCTVTTTDTDEQFIIEILGENVGDIIGYRGETLDAVQYLASQIANQERENSKKIVVDCQNYRKKRMDTLIALAARLADKAVKTSRRVSMEPMNAYERRIIHSALSENTDVTTVSEGDEPNRYLVIVPKNCRSDFKGSGRSGSDRRDNRSSGNHGSSGGRGGYGNHGNSGNRGGFANQNKRNDNRSGNRNNFSNQTPGSGFSENTGFTQTSGFEESSYGRRNNNNNNNGGFNG